MSSFEPEHVKATLVLRSTKPEGELPRTAYSTSKIHSHLSDKHIGQRVMLFITLLLSITVAMTGTRRFFTLLYFFLQNWSQGKDQNHFGSEKQTDCRHITEQ